MTLDRKHFKHWEGAWILGNEGTAVLDSWVLGAMQEALVFSGVSRGYSQARRRQGEPAEQFSFNRLNSVVQGRVLTLKAQVMVWGAAEECGGPGSAWLAGSLHTLHCLLLTLTPPPAWVPPTALPEKPQSALGESAPPEWRRTLSWPGVLSGSCGLQATSRCPSPCPQHLVQLSRPRAGPGGGQGTP